MRILVALLVVLAGCAQPSPAIEPDEAPAVAPAATVNWTRQLLHDGAVTWHDDGSPLYLYKQVGQATFHPCLWNDGQEIYFTNQALVAPLIPNGTKHIAITLDWDDTSYLRDTLRIGHRAPSADRFSETAPFKRGQEMLVRVGPEDYAEPGVVWGTGIVLWACLDTDELEETAPPSIFRGELRFKVEAVA